MVRIVLAAFLLVLLPATAIADKRIAFVVGNSEYVHTPRLVNPRNDAIDMVAALKKFEFRVIEGYDLDKAAFDKKLRELVEALENADVGLFFYAGHGLQVSGKNYVVPTDARLKTMASLQFEVLKVDDIQTLMQGSSKTSVIFLDACRNNPLARDLAAVLGTRSDVGRGLAEIRAGVGTLISFSTQPGNVALDGKGRNSPFTGPLVRHILSSRGDLSNILIHVRNDVLKETNGNQVPWEHVALTRPFYFSLEGQPAATSQSPIVTISEAAEAWDRTKDTASIDVLIAFVKRFEHTYYGDLAKLRIKQLTTNVTRPPEQDYQKSADPNIRTKPDPKSIPTTSTAKANQPVLPSTPKILTGAYRLVAENFAPISGKRVGIITNQTGMAGPDGHLVDRLARADNVVLTAILVPEHGWEGRAGAGEEIGTKHDSVTGKPIFSLYGKTRKPTPEMLKDIDILIFDIQDVGSRFYTYISTMGLAMQAAAASNIAFLVLDRPNPLGGEYVSGFVLEDDHRSFVGQYRIPIVHGMTVGELARMIHKESLLPGLQKLRLSVLAMEGWERRMRWQDISDVWIRTSPAINRSDAALMYPGMGLLESISSVNDGRGTNYPFQLIGAEWMDQHNMVARLNAQGFPGLSFEPAEFIPELPKGKVTSTRLAGKVLKGVRILVTDHKVVAPLEAGIGILKTLREHAREQDQSEIIDKKRWLAYLAGTQRLYDQLERGRSINEITASWKEEIEKFKAARGPYLLYR